jgi:1,4-alpha-glucan branching enzyme
VPPQIVPLTRASCGDLLPETISYMSHTPSAPETASDPQESKYLAGEPFPQGATWDGQGVNFALFSEGAEMVELCLFDHTGDKQESARIRLRERTNGVWHIYLPDIKPGQRLQGARSL